MASSSTVSWNSSMRQTKAGRSSGVARAVVCDHDLPVEYKTSNTDKNPARRFYCCSVRKWDDCGVWQWVDSELSPYYKSCMNKLKIERDKAVEQLKVCDAHELKQQLHVSYASIHELKVNNARLGEIINKNAKQGRFRLGLVVVLALVAYVLAVGVSNSYPPTEGAN